MADTNLNTRPIYSRSPHIEWGTISAANTAKDGTGTVVTVFTGDATNGGRLEKIRIRSLGTNVATVLRIFINNGSVNSAPTNNTLYTELTLPATTLSETAQLLEQEIAMNLAIPPSYKINCTLGTAVAAGYSITGIGGIY